MEFNQLVTLLYKGALETLYMVILSTACSYLAGIPLGVLLFITDKNGRVKNSLSLKAKKSSLREK